MHYFHPESLTGTTTKQH